MSKKAHKFQFDLLIRKVILHIDFDCQLQVIWKLGNQKVETQEKIDLDIKNSQAVFDKILSINSTFYLENNLFQEKKSTITVVLTTVKGTKVVGITNLNVHNNLNDKIIEKNEIYQLERCPDKNAQIDFQLKTKYLGEASSEDAVSVSQYSELSNSKFMDEKILTKSNSKDGQEKIITNELQQEKEQLLIKIKNLELQLTEYIDRCIQIEKVKQAEQSNFNKTINDKEFQIQQLQQDHKHLLSQIQIQEQEIESNQKKIKELKYEQQKEIDDLMYIQSQKISKIDELSCQLKDLNLQVEKFQSTNKEIEVKLQNKIEQVNNFEDQLLQKTQESQKLKLIIDEINQLKNQQVQRNQEDQLDQEISDKYQLKKNIEEITNLEEKTELKQIEQFQKQFELQINQINSLSKQIDEKNLEIQNLHLQLNDNLKQISKQLDDKNLEIQNLQYQLDEKVQVIRDKEIQDLQLLLDEKNNQLTNQSQQFHETFQSDIEKKNLLIENLQISQKESLEQINLLQNQISDYQNQNIFEEIESLKNELQQNQIVLQRLEEENEQLIRNNIELKNNIIDVQNSLQQNGQDLNQQIEEKGYQDLQNENKNLIQQLSEQQLNFDLLQQQIQFRNFELSQKVLQIQKLEKDLIDDNVQKNQQDEFERIRKENISIQKNLQESKDRISLLQLEKQQQYMEIQELRSYTDQVKFLEHELMRTKQKMGDCLNGAFDYGGSELVDYLTNAMTQ